SSLMLPPPTSTLFPYTTLFRSVSARGSMYDPSAVFYMSKLVTGPAAADLVDIEAPVAHNVGAVAKAKACSPQDVTVVILDRPRQDRKSTRLNSSHVAISYAVFC